MSCPVKLNSIKYLQDKKAINNKREVIDYPAFVMFNNKLTERAIKGYGVETFGQKLFGEETRSVPRGDGSRRTLIRAIPNEMLFNDLQRQIEDNTSNEKSIIDLPAPVVTFKGLTDDQLIDTDTPLVLKEQQDKLKEDIEKFNNLIKCIWP